jgi:hypothetical protein
MDSTLVANKLGTICFVGKSEFLGLGLDIVIMLFSHFEKLSRPNSGLRWTFGIPSLFCVVVFSRLQSREVLVRLLSQKGV